MKYQRKRESIFTCFEMVGLEIWSTSGFILFLKRACKSELNEIWTLCSPYSKNQLMTSWLELLQFLPFFYTVEILILYQSAWRQETKLEIHLTYLERPWKNCNVHPSWPNHDLSHKKDQNSPNPHWKHHGILPTIDVFQNLSML